MSGYKIKKGDKVVVLAGRDKDQKGEVVKVVTAKDRVVVKGVNIAKKHTRQSATQSGGIVEKEVSVHISNVALLDPKEEVKTRVGYKFLENGEKVRISKKTGEVI